MPRWMCGKVLNSCYDQPSAQGLDPIPEGWFILYICIVNDMTVEQAIRAWEHGRRKKRRPTKWWTEEEKELLIREISAGKSSAEVAKMLDRDPHTVRTYISTNRARGIKEFLELETVSKSKTGRLKKLK